MQGQVQGIHGFTFQPPESTYMLATVQLKAPSLLNALRNSTFSIDATVPPATDISTIMQRGDELMTVLRMLTDLQTSAVALSGDAGAGKSTLAALLYRRLQLTSQAGLPAPRHFVWLSLGAYTTLPDMIAAILSGLHTSEPSFFLLKPAEQIAALLRALRRPQEAAFVVLNQFEALLDTETQLGLEGRGNISSFLEMLLQDLGASRVLLTCHRSPFPAHDQDETRVRSFLVSRISLPEGIALLQQRGVQGAYEELSLTWQRCGGHVFALVLFSAFMKLSGLSLSYLLNSPDYQPLWSGEVPLHLLAAIYAYLNPIQYTLVSVLSLFTEPVTAQGLLMAIFGDTPPVNAPVYEQELAQLTQLSLVQLSANQEDLPCYSLHPLFRQYILENYLAPGTQRPGSTASTSLGVAGAISPIMEGQEAREVARAAGHMRVAAYYQHKAAEHHLPREKRSGPQDIADLLATVRHLCLGWHWQQACDQILSEGIYENMVQWGAWNTLIGLYMAMMPPYGVLTRRDEGLICNHVGLLYDRLGNSSLSLVYYERALYVQRKIQDRHGEAITLTNQGELFRGIFDWQQARINFEEARKLNRKLKDSLLESVLLHNLGILHHAVKDYQQALIYYKEALRFARTLEERYNEGMILTNIGVLFYEQGYHAEALAVLFYTLQQRQSLQYATVSYIEHFLTTLEDNMELNAFATLRQASREKEARVISSLGG
ncbi:MAG TPA: tetratricopeptide repeat protein [Ktedonobacteraceae bacterium]